LWKLNDMELKANELRIGNWIADRGGKQWQIDHWESMNKVSAKTPVSMCMGILMEGHPLTEYVDYLKPIPLTEDWLIRFGGKPLKNGYWISITNLRGELHFETFNHTDEIVTTIKSQFSDLILDRIKYVHTFQNLYFALTGEELTDKTTK